jgi:hypothetical protein
MKIMKNTTVTEYEIIKLLREIQIMKAVAQKSKHILGESVIPELIEIITPPVVPG